MGRQLPMIDFSISPSQSISHDQNSSIFNHETTQFAGCFFIACAAITVVYLTLLSVYNLLLRPHRRPADAVAAREMGSPVEAAKDFKVKVYERGRDGGEEAGTCDVCLEDFEEGRMVKVLPRCGHVYHVRCIDDWLRRSVSCPHCRKSVIDLDKGIANISSELAV